MKLTIFTIFYGLVMLLVSSLYNSTIMDPIGLLWILCYVLVGPVLLIASIVILVRRVIRRSIGHPEVAATGLSIITVLVWTLGFWRIGEFMRPILFGLVASENERLAISFMQQQPPNSEVRVSGFRYPFFDLGSTRVSHHNGSVSIMIPSAPGPKDFLVYVAPGCSRPIELRPICKSWYYYDASLL